MKSVFYVLPLLMAFSIINSSNTFGQKCIIQHSGVNDLTLNGMPVNGMTVNDLDSLLGEASRTEVKGKETGWYYDDLGVVFTSIDSMIKMIGVNFNWDGDEHFPSTPYTGTLYVGELKITQSTNKKAIEGIKKIELKCPVSFLCGPKDRSVPIWTTVAFKNEKITQVLILIH